mmetsp:Transcript_25141/g.73739  ORF Transcript_25141/g.73739 Transcript_25141/m.73739 type:complete len:278 (+) Transcript_25141:218-1051(+)
MSPNLLPLLHPGNDLLVRMRPISRPCGRLRRVSPGVSEPSRRQQSPPQRRLVVVGPLAREYQYCSRGGEGGEGAQERIQAPEVHQHVRGDDEVEFLSSPGRDDAGAMRVDARSAVEGVFQGHILQIHLQQFIVQRPPPRIVVVVLLPRAVVPQSAPRRPRAFLGNVQHLSGGVHPHDGTRDEGTEVSSRQSGAASGVQRRAKLVPAPASIRGRRRRGGQHIPRGLPHQPRNFIFQAPELDVERLREVVEQRRDELLRLSFVRPPGPRRGTLPQYPLQ